MSAVYAISNGAGGNDVITVSVTALRGNIVLWRAGRNGPADGFDGRRNSCNRAVDGMLVWYLFAGAEKSSRSPRNGIEGEHLRPRPETCQRRA